MVDVAEVSPCSDQLVTWQDRLTANGLTCSNWTTATPHNELITLRPQEVSYNGRSYFTCNGNTNTYTLGSFPSCTLSGADLTVLDIVLTGTSSPREALPIRFTGTVKNVGTQSTASIDYGDRFLYCWGDGCTPGLSLGYRGGRTDLDVGEEMLVNSNLMTPDRSGLLRVQLCADISNDLNEVNEGDNCLLKEFTVDPAGGVGIICPILPTLYVGNWGSLHLRWWADDTVTPTCELAGFANKTIVANWSSSLPGVLSINNSFSKGNYNALASGTAVVRADFGGNTYQQTVRVENGTPNLRPYDGISIVSGFMITGQAPVLGAQIENNGTGHVNTPTVRGGYKYCYGDACVPDDPATPWPILSYPLGVGGRTSLIYSIGLPMYEGLLRVEFCADPLDAIAELDESDNCVIAEYNVVGSSGGEWAFFNPINDCEIPEGDSTCWTDVAWTSGGINNSTHQVSVKHDTDQFSDREERLPPGWPRQLSHGMNRFTFEIYEISRPGNITELASAEATASCAPGSSWDVSFGECRAAPTPGVCGAAARVYDFDETTYEYPLCAQGNPSPVAPPFPTIGDSETWQCLGLNGGENASCGASRSDPPDPDLTIAVCDIAEDEADCLTVPGSVTWNLQIGSPSYFIRNITNGEAIGPTASTSAGVSADTRRITLDYGVNTVQGIANGVELVEISPNVTCLPGLFWHSDLAPAVCKAPPVVTIITPASDNLWIRAGQTVTVEYSVTANYSVECTVDGLGAGAVGPAFNDTHDGSPADVNYSAITAPLYAAQEVRVTCLAPGFPASSRSDTVRINVLPSYQEL